MQRLAQLIQTFRERLLAGFSWNIASAISLQGSVLLSTILVARLLGLEPFGIYSILITTVTTTAAIAQGGSGLVATKFVAEFQALDPTRVAPVLKMCRIFTFAAGSLAAVALSLAAPVISEEILHKPELVGEVRLIAIATFFQVLVSYHAGALQGFGAFRELSRASLLAGVAYIALTAAGGWSGGLPGAVYGFILATIVRTIVFSYVLDKVRRAHGVPDKSVLHLSECRLIWRFAFPASLGGFITMPCIWFVTVLIARLPDGLSMVALYSAAYQIRLAVLQLPSLLNSVSFSVLSRLKHNSHAINFRNVFWANVAANVGFSVVVVGVLASFADQLLALYGTQFVAGRWLLIALLLSVLPETVTMCFYQIIQSAGRMWRSFFVILLPRDLLYLSITVVALPIYGALGAAGAFLVAQLITLVATLVTVRRLSSNLVGGIDSFYRQ